MKVLLVILFCFVCPTTLAIGEGDVAPSFKLPELGSGSIEHSLLQYRGKVIYLDFWAAWCGPCRISIPEIVKLQAALGSDQFVVLAINLDSDIVEARSFLVSYPINYTVLSDPEGRVAGLYQLPGMPTSFLIDKSGKIVLQHIGYRSGDMDSIRMVIENLLNDED